MEECIGMKKLLILVIILCLFTTTAAATNSPTIRNKISCVPKIHFELTDNTYEWREASRHLAFIRDELKMYEMEEALYIILEDPCDSITWHFLKPYHEPVLIALIDSEAIVLQEAQVTEDGDVIVDFSKSEPNFYYMCLYVRK